MGFEILVLRKGRHFFAVHERSLSGSATFKMVSDEIQAKFPESEGFEVRAYRTSLVKYEVCPNDPFGVILKPRDGDKEAFELRDA
jgi:hypothetical protein